MKEIYVIQNIKTKEYFCQYRIEEYWSLDLEEALEYSSDEKALKDLNNSNYLDSFESKVVEIKKYYKICD